jgi:hypothetical protein
VLILPAHEMGDSVEDSALPPACAGSRFFFNWSWGLRPRLYSATCFAGSAPNKTCDPSFAGLRSELINAIRVYLWLIFGGDCRSVRRYGVVDFCRP